MSKYNLETISDENFERQFTASIQQGKEYLRSAQKAVSARFDRESRRMIFEMTTKITFIVSVDLLQGLQTDDLDALEDFELMFEGTEIHWETLDAQFRVGNLLNGQFGTPKWMDKLSEHLSAIGRKGGRAKTPAKRAASAENGKKGGRPRAKVTA